MEKVISKNSFNTNILKSIIFFLLMLYPILPLNFYIGPLSYANICSLLIVILYLIYKKGCIDISGLKYIRPYWIYLLVYASFAFYAGKIMSGVAWIISTFMVSIVITDIVKTEYDFQKIIQGFIIASLIIGILGIIESLSGQYLFQSARMEEWGSQNYYRYGFLRCTSLFGHPINLGVFQAIAATLIFYLFLSKTITVKRKKLYIIIYIVDVLSMLLTVSRLPIVVFAICHVFLILKLGVRKTIRYLCLGFLIFLASVFLMDTIGLDVFGMISDILPAIKELLGIENNKQNVVNFGNRMDLYGWVILAVGNNYLFGNGFNAEFAYKMTDWFTKTSIEVQYLYIYFKCGLVGLSFLILSYCSTIIFFWRRKNKKYKYENKVGFGYAVTIIICSYCASLFGVNESDLARMYSLIVSLGIAYHRMIKNKGCVG